MNDGIPKIGGFGVSQTKDDLSESSHAKAETPNWMSPGLCICVFVY
jgi:hypothetical protein